MKWQLIGFHWQVNDNHDHGAKLLAYSGVHMPPFSSNEGTGIPETTVMEEMKEKKVLILHLRKDKVN